MELVRILVAAAAAFALGAAWYMSLAEPWVRAAGVPVDAEGRPQGNGSRMPFLIGYVAMLLVAVALRYVFVRAQVTSPVQGLTTGLGLGLFVIVPWSAMNNAYAMRPALLTAIDGGYAILACGVIGVVLTLI